MAIYRDKHEGNYSILGNQLTQYADLSPTALGVLTRLLPRPKDWTVIIEEVIASFGGRRGPVTRAFKELEEAGYLVRELDENGNPVRPRGENGEYLPYEWDVYETPRKATTQTGNSRQAGKSEPDTPQHESAESKPETGGAFSGFRARVYHDGFSHDGLSMMENRQLQSTNPTKDESDQVRKKTNNQTTKHEHARTPAAGPTQQTESAFGGGVGKSLSETGEHEVDEVADREGVEFSVKEQRQDTGPQEALFRQWGGINLHTAIVQASPQRIVRAMLYVAECLYKPNQGGINDKNGVLVNTITGDKQIPSPDSATAPSPEYAWLWDEAAALGIIDAQPDADKDNGICTACYDPRCNGPDDPYCHEAATPAEVFKKQNGNTESLLPDGDPDNPQRVRMSPRAAQIFDSVYARLEIQYDRATYNNWLKGLHCVAWENINGEDHFTLSAPDESQYEMLSQRLQRGIYSIFRDYYDHGHPVTVTWQRWQDAINQANQAVAIA